MYLNKETFTLDPLYPVRNNGIDRQTSMTSLKGVLVNKTNKVSLI